MNERDDLNRALMEFKTAVLQTKPGKAVYTAAVYIADALERALEKIVGGKR